MATTVAFAGFLACSEVHTRDNLPSSWFGVESVDDHVAIQHNTNKRPLQINQVKMRMGKHAPVNIMPEIWQPLPLPTQRVAPHELTGAQRFPANIKSIRSIVAMVSVGTASYSGSVSHRHTDLLRDWRHVTVFIEVRTPSTRDKANHSEWSCNPTKSARGMSD